MAMAQSTLEQELLNLDPQPTEAGAAAILTDAYGAFVLEAEAGGVMISEVGVDLGKAAMLPALTGMSLGNAETFWSAAVIAFWGAVAGALTGSFAGATLITPPPHAGLSTLLSAAFTANIATQASKETAMAVLAAVFYSQAIVGGTVTFPGPVVAPII